MDKCDAIVVFGGRITRDGILHSVLRIRVAKAIELYNSGVAPRLIFTGGTGITVMGTRFLSEAEAMQKFAIEEGIPEEAILLEDRSRDTFENAFFVRTKYLDPNGWNRIAVVANGFHIVRVRYIFEKMLGSAYKIEMVEAENGLDLKPKFLADKEEALMKFTCSALDSLDAGNVQEIRELLCDFHPVYRQGSE